ncbi:MAG: hypothetical protein ACFB6R_00750 [Alphaproteobacteria bacterium]
MILKRSGRRPLCFSGSLLAEATSWSAERAVWYEGALYEAADGGFVASLSAFHKAAERPDRHLASPFAGADEAAAWLRAYDPDGDVWVDLDGPSGDGETRDSAAEEQSLRDALADVREAFRAMITALLPREAAAS